MRLSHVAVAAAAVLVSGCATVVHGSRQTVLVTSDPSGATVTVLSGTTVKSSPGVTPIHLELTRRDPHITLRIARDGCAPVDVAVKRTTSGWVMGNLFAANPFAQQGMDQASAGAYGGQLAMTAGLFAVDYASGAAHSLPKRIDVPLCR